MFARIKDSYLKTVMIVLTSVFVGTLFLSLFHMSADVTSHSPGCPMMMKGGVICQMDFNEHMSTWSELTLAVPMLLLLLFLVPLAKAFTVASSILFNQSALVWGFLAFNFYQKQVPSYTVRGFQELFSSGILHPKLYHLA